MPHACKACALPFELHPHYGGIDVCLRLHHQTMPRNQKGGPKKAGGRRGKKNKNIYVKKKRKKRERDREREREREREKEEAEENKKKKNQTTKKAGQYENRTRDLLHPKQESYH